MADERPIPTIGDTNLDDLTYGRLRAVRRAKEHIRIVRDASQLLYEAQMILLEFSDPYHPTANILLWDIEARMEILVDEFLALWAEEIQDRAFELRQFKWLPELCSELCPGRSNLWAGKVTSFHPYTDYPY